MCYYIAKILSIRLISIIHRLRGEGGGGRWRKDKGCQLLIAVMYPLHYGMATVTTVIGIYTLLRILQNLVTRFLIR